MSTAVSHPTASNRRPPPGTDLRHDPPHHKLLGEGIDRARRCLLARQCADGHWVGELQGDTILESEYVLLMAFLGREGEERVAKAARYLLTQQQPGGGWGNYPGGPPDLSVTVKAYFALKLTGHDPQSPPLRRARTVARRLGGAARCNSFTKFYLALLGQFPYDNCASVPPEMLLLPRWAYFNIYAMSSWTRTIVVPLSIFSAHKPVRRLPPERGIAELFLDAPRTPLWPAQPTRRLLTWGNFFLVVDQLVKWYERWGPRSLREAAVRRAADWLLEHFEDSDGVGAIFPPMVYTVIGLHCLGHGPDTPEMRWALKQLDDLIIEEGDTVRLQPCFSPVWDTALTLNALGIAGLGGRHPAVRAGVQWLLAREVRRRGDWSLLNPDLEPGGWFFEYRNGFYPDTDDTAMALMALARTGNAWASGARAASANGRPAETCFPIPAVERGVRWLLGMQNSDGGWAAFDRDINREVLTKVPFADHNAMLDPSCPDITARVLEALGQYGYRIGQDEVDRAVGFIERTQDRRGCWLGRWGVNYLYGTWQVLAGLQAVGYDMNRPLVRRAVAWLESVQQECGGWGETCASYDDPNLAGQGTPTASQTAWALLGLLAAGAGAGRTAAAGVAYLLATQRPDGNWDEEPFTGTGFPKVFYLKYHLYRLYFPLMALARYAQAHGIPVSTDGAAAHGRPHNRQFPQRTEAVLRS
ncbi:MAG: squalene--hopene cyclase [Gemmataceae bacterium]|nr:squalene--hopene cyclase [Gemmataceae bacterium]